MRHKMQILFSALYGELIKLYYSIIPWSFSYGLNQNEIRKEKVIISLTSYGRRIKTVLPFTIISLLRQTCKPDKIILWLDENHWNDEKLPKLLVKLKNYGLEVRYCKDIGSYTKLIPALKAYPNDLIITVDDDLYYRNDMVKGLVESFYSDSTFIYSYRAYKIQFDNNNKLKPYNNWGNEISGVKGSLIFPLGCGGCLYKKSFFYSDILREDLFLKLAPKADDIWFFFMEFLHQTKCCVLSNKSLNFIPIDLFYQCFNKNSSLANTNCKQSQNDVQIRNVMSYYNITDEDLFNVSNL